MVLTFFIAGLLYLLRFRRVDNLGAYGIPFGDRPAHPIWLRQLASEWPVIAKLFSKGHAAACKIWFEP